MRFVYPQSVLSPRLPDEMFQEEAAVMAQAGFAVSRINCEKLGTSTSKIIPPITDGETVVYRGWMLSPSEYENFCNSVIAAGGQPFTSRLQYLATHYLPNWYQAIADLTPETIVLSRDADWVRALTELGWPRFFVKDYVKSLKTSVGSLIERPEDVHIIASEMQKYRGFIEGGLCIRRVEDFLPETEKRYFILDNNPYGPEPQGTIPDLVFDCARRIESHFFSVDVVCRSDGQFRIVEIGDGQVSDVVGWTVERFAGIWRGVL